MLKKVDQNIWTSQIPIRYLGVSIRTRMTVVRLSNQSLVVISPIPISNELAAQLHQLGQVKHIVAPNVYHYLFADSFQQAYPQATFWASAGLKEKKPSLAIDRVLTPGKDFVEGLESLFFEGYKTLGTNGFDAFNETVFFHRESRTLILTDAAFYIDNTFPLLTQFVFKATGSYGLLSPSLLERIASSDKAAVKASVEQILGWDFERVIMAHGNIIERNGKEKFKQGYERFLGRSL